MKFIPRRIAPTLLNAAKAFPAVLLTGPRRAGKTTLLRRLFPRASYVLLEDQDVIARVRADPRGFLDEIRPPAILDEIQNAPELLNYVRTRIDHVPSRKGQWLLTGSQEAPLMRGVTESMAGRAAVFHLLPLSTEESPRVSLLRGGFPEVLAHPKSAPTWFRSYLQTYLERDVRAVSSIRDLATYRRFLSLLASRSGQILSKTDLAAPLGISVPTVGEWLNILEVTSQILLVPPYFENFGKRLIKSPKLYFGDSGLACHLLGIDSERILNHSVFLEPIFEGFVASEIAKHQVNAGRAKEVYYFRDAQGLEVDFVIRAGGGKLALLEAKASRTVTPTVAAPLTRLAASIRGREVARFVIHRPTGEAARMHALAPGVRALGLEHLPQALGWK